MSDGRELVDTTVAAPKSAVRTAANEVTSEVTVLSFARTNVERRVLAEWLADNRTSLRDPAVVAGETLAAHPGDLPLDEGAQLLPVRVVWRSPLNRGRLRNIAAAVNSRVPVGPLQSAMLRADPDGCRVVVGESATRGDLRAAFEGRKNGTDSFGKFVGRRAELALDRAERAGSDGPSKVPRFIMDEVKSSERFLGNVDILASATGLSPDAVASRKADYLEEMAADHSRLAIEAFDRFGRFLTRAFTVSYDVEALERLRQLNQRHTLVFLPSHRSYLDPFIVRSALLANRFPTNFCFAGNNMAFWPMGTWVRRTGNIVLRRNIGDDDIYKDTLRTYLQYLMSKRLNFEWYIEGGRTRTGKLRPPKFGLLTYLVDAYDEMVAQDAEDPTDVYLVPISLIYDGLPEVSALTAEQTGAQKKNEQISWLLNYPRSTGAGFGKVHLSVGEPLSLTTAMSDQKDVERRVRVQKVAFEVCHRIDDATPVTATALIAFALLGVGDRALTFAEIRAVVAPLLGYVDQRKLPVTVDLAEPEELRAVLDWLSGTGVLICYEKGVETVWGISPDRQLDAAFYRNSIIHHLVHRAILELVLVSAVEGKIHTVREGWREALRLRDLLKFEFFFPGKREFFMRLSNELTLINADWEQHAEDPRWWGAALADARPHFAYGTLHSYVEAYFVTADRLAAHPSDKPVQDKAFISQCYGFARQRYMQQRLQSSDSISTEVFRNAYRAAGHRDLLGPGGDDLAQRRRAFADELAELLLRFQALQQLDTSASEVGERS